MQKQKLEYKLPEFLLSPEESSVYNIQTAAPSAAFIFEGLKSTQAFFEKLRLAYSSKSMFKLQANFGDVNTIVFEFARQIFGWNENAELYIYSAEFVAAKYMSFNPEQKSLLTVQITVDFLLNQFFPCAKMLADYSN